MDHAAGIVSVSPSSYNSTTFVYPAMSATGLLANYRSRRSSRARFEASPKHVDALANKRAKHPGNDDAWRAA